MKNTVDYHIIAAKSGHKTIVVTKDNKQLYLHSKYDPIKESTGLQPDRKSDSLIVLGCGLGYQLLSLKEHINTYKKIIIIDILSNIEKEIAQNTSTSFLYNINHITFITGKSTGEVIQRLSENLKLAQLKGISIIEHPNSFRIFPDYYQQVLNAIIQLINHQAGNIATQKAFGLRFIKNIMQNCKYLANYSEISQLYNTFENRSALVITSGPSLDKYIDKISQNQHKFFIIAVDSALSPLVRNGITPDFVISIDPQPYITEHYLNLEESAPIRIISISASPHIFKKNSGYVALNSHPVSQIIEQYLNLNSTLESGTGNVAGDAVELAVLCGFKTIGLIGFDFSFPFYSIYARGTSYQHRYALFFQDRVCTVETRNLDYIMKSSNAFKIGSAYSRKSFLEYKNGLVNLINRNSSTDLVFINRFGITINDRQPGDLETFIKEHCPLLHDKQDFLEKIRSDRRTLQFKPAHGVADFIQKTLANRKIFDEFLSIIGSGSMKQSSITKIKKLLKVDSKQ